jgi:hypothetical protein
LERGMSQRSELRWLLVTGLDLVVLFLNVYS